MGESTRQSRPKLAAAATKAAALIAVKSAAENTVTLPVGSSRPAVRGFLASSRRSTMRLNPMAAVRAPAMATKIATTCASVMPCPRAASAVAANAKGKANKVWLNFTMRPKVATAESTEGIVTTIRSACCAAAE